MKPPSVPLQKMLIFVVRPTNNKVDIKLKITYLHILESEALPLIFSYITYFQTHFFFFFFYLKLESFNFYYFCANSVKTTVPIHYCRYIYGIRLVNFFHNDLVEK